MEYESPIIVALDYHNIPQVLELVDRLNPETCRLKVGKELFTKEGPKVIDVLHKKGFEVFLDLKFHDIPNTASAAVRVASDMGVWMVNVHVLGGRRMLEACHEVVASKVGKKPLLIGVTVLTSMQMDDFKEFGLFFDSVPELTKKLSILAADCGLDGVVCSAWEVPELSALHRDSFCFVTPGIRFADSEANDQKRIATPKQAIENGSDYLVMGRSITQSKNPEQAIATVLKDLKAFNK